MTDVTSTIDWEPLKELVRAARSIVLTSHVRPDCDALGSELAMAGLLDQLNKPVRIVNADPIPPRLAFVDPESRIEKLGDGDSLADLGPEDIIMILDTSAWRQLGEMGEVIRQTSARVVIIDHHASEGEVPATVFKDPQSEATGRLIFEAAQHFGITVTPEMASAMFAAIATDTGWFRFSSTTSQTYQVISHLVAAGANPAAIFRDLYERDSMSRAKLRGIVLSRIVTEVDGRLAHTHVLAEDFAETGALPSETEDFVNMGLAIEGTEVAVMMTEQPVGTVKVSFRSRRDVDCSELAGSFGGGGHRAAAGATLEGPFESVQLQVLSAVRAAMQG